MFSEMFEVSPLIRPGFMWLYPPMAFNTSHLVLAPGQSIIDSD